MSKAYLQHRAGVTRFTLQYLGYAARGRQDRISLETMLRFAAVLRVVIAFGPDGEVWVHNLPVAPQRYRHYWLRKASQTDDATIE